MVVLNGGCNRIRDLLFTDLTTGIAGSSSTPVTAFDVGVTSSISGTNLTLTNTKSDKQLTTENIIGSNAAVGSTFQESADMLSTGVGFSHIIHTSIVKTSTMELHEIHSYFFNQSP